MFKAKIILSLKVSSVNSRMGHRSLQGKYFITWRASISPKRTFGCVPACALDLCLIVPCFPAFFDLLISLGQ